MLLCSIALLAAVYAVSSMALLSGLAVYYVPSAMWLAAFIILLVRDPALRETSKVIVATALAIGVFQVALLYDVAMMFGELGRSPYSLTPFGLAVNTVFVYSRVLAFEFTRASVIKRFRRKPGTAIALTAVAFALLVTPLSSFSAALSSGEDLAIFLTSSLLPLLAQSALASYLVLVGGPWASIAYTGVIEGVLHYSPYLPDVGWMIEGLLGVTTPIVGFTVVSLMLSLSIPRLKKKHMELRRSLNRGIKMVAVAGCLVLVTWASIGAFGVKPVVMVGRSMEPSINMGDIVLVAKASPSDLKPGDVIQYYHESIGPITHRIIEVRHEGGELFFVTKGDANEDVDPWLVHSSQLMGKVVFVIPKLGWIAIAIRSIPSLLTSTFGG